MNGQIAGIDKFYFISQMPFFSGLSWLQRRMIAARAYAVEYRKGQVIYRQGDPPDALYCLATGRVAAFTTARDGREDILEYLYRGGYFGIISLLTGEPHSVNTRAVNDSIILKINKSEFNAILKSIPKLAIDMSRTLSRRLKSKDIHGKTVFESTIISVYSNVRSTGRTTYAINLALSLAKETRKRVVLLDMSPSGKVIASILGLAAGSPAMDLRQAGFDYSKIKEGILTSPHGIDLLNISHLPDKKSDITHVTPLLTCLATDYHYIVSDLPYETDQTVFKALTQSDIIHIITNPYHTTLKSTCQLIDILKKSIPESVPRIKIIVNELKEKSPVDSKGRSHILRNKIYGTLPFIQEPGQRPAPKDVTAVISQPDSEYARVVRRIARDAGGILVGLALGSGTALGLIHIGVLKVLEREKIPIDVIAGSSIGALIAAFWASGLEAKDIEDIVLMFKSKLSLFKLIDPAIPKSGLIGGRKIMKLLHRHLGKKTFQDVALPVRIVACDIDRQEAVVLEDGLLKDAVRASIAIPGILRPVKYRERRLVDGGILEPVPVGTLIQIGTKKIIAVNCLPGQDDIAERFERYNQYVKNELARPFSKSPVQYISYRIIRLLKKVFTPTIFGLIVNAIQGMEYAMAEAACQQADILIHPHMADASWHEFFKAERLIKMGEEEAERLLPQIKGLLAE